jgi:guanylate kinase
VIFVATPSREEQAQRLRGRGEPEEQIQVRLARAPLEEEIGAQIADHVVVNDDLDRAVDEVAGILEAHRSTGES